MKKTLKRILSLLLVAILIVGSLPAINFAETEQEYNYIGKFKSGISIVTKIGSSSTKNALTELMLVSPKGSTSPQIFAYCVDWENSLVTSQNYTSNGLESLDYLNTEKAGKIRAIMNGGYPSLTVEALKNAVNVGLSNSDKIGSLSDVEAITATQAAIWKYSNNVDVLWDSTSYPGVNKADIQKVYNYLIDLAPVNAPSTPQIETTTPIVAIDNGNIVISFKYKNVLPNPSIQLSLDDYSMTESDVENGWKQVLFTKSLADATINDFADFADFADFTIQVSGTNNVTDAFSFVPVSGRTSTQTLVSLGLTKQLPVTISLNGSTSTLLASLTVNKSFDDRSTTEVKFELFKGETKVDEGTTANQTITFSNIIPGTYTLKEVAPARYTSSLGVGKELTFVAGESKVENVTNTPEKLTKITVHHVSDTGATLRPDVYHEGYADQNYTVAPIDITNYSVFERPNPETGLFGPTDFEVTYVYKENPKSKVIAIYVDTNDAELASPVEVEDYVGADYTTTAKTINNYTLTATPTNAGGVHAEGTTTVKYVYVENDKSAVNIYFVDENGDPVAGEKSLSGYVGAPYTTSPEPVKNYTLKTTPDNAEGTFGESTITVTYVYQQDPKTTITVRHVEVSGDTLIDLITPVDKSGFADESYTTSRESIPNYSLLTTPENANGVYGSTPFEVVYVYAPNDKITITVLHVDEDEVEISDRAYEYGYPNNPYTTSSKEISGYKLLSTPENANGNFGEQSSFVVYVYEKEQVSTGDDGDDDEEEPETPQPPTPPAPQPTEPQGPQGTVTINYVTTEGASLASPFAFTGTIGSNYVSTARIFEGFELIETPANAAGTFTEAGVTVTYVYSDGTETIEEENVALAAPPLDLDLIYALSTPFEPTTEGDEVVVIDEEVPLAEALPKTGQASPELFYGIGGLITAAGVFLKKRK